MKRKQVQNEIFNFDLSKMFKTMHIPFNTKKSTGIEGKLLVLSIL